MSTDVRCRRYEIGCPIEGASKGLQRLIEVGFCTFDEPTETVWVHEMARYQIGESLKPKDKRQIHIQRIFAAIENPLIQQGFLIEQASQKQNPGEYIAGVIRGGAGPPAFGERQTNGFVKRLLDRQQDQHHEPDREPIDVTPTADQPRGQGGVAGRKELTGG